MKRILGLDLGSSSIGWAVIETAPSIQRIVKIGSRIVPLTTDDETQFSKGQAITKNAGRTAMRTARKGLDRFQMRRHNLKAVLGEIGITPVDCERPIDLWILRSKAATEQVSLDELGRVLLHINKKRGYKSGKEDFNDSSKSKYVQSINDNYRFLIENNLTLGQYFTQELLKDGSFRVKDRVYPRIAYIDEFNQIINCQKQFYPDILTDKIVNKLKDEIIFYQRKLKSCKHLVSLCEFEKREYQKDDGTIIVSGPKVAPKSSPVAQLCKVWEFINTIKITNRVGEELFITLDQKERIADFLSKNIKIKITDLQKILGISKKDGWWIDKTISQRNIGNSTLVSIAGALGGKYQELLSLDINFEDIVDINTGEIRKKVSENIKKEPLFMLWHTLYSVSEEQELRTALKNKFGIEDEEVLDGLCHIDFLKEGYSNKSNTAIRKILPYLMEGNVYSEACALAGYNHRGYMTKEQNLQRELKSKLELIKKGEMRQPIVEKILNQAVNIVNSLVSEYGTFDEIRVELARELKQSREERAKTTQMISKNERENKAFSERISEYGFIPTRNRILKMKIWEETHHLCIYCNQPVNVTEFLSGIDFEKEHIIPKSLLFDNSSNNVTCSCRKCNHEKGNMTAYDFMKSKGDAAFEEYAKKVTSLLESKDISKAKYIKLMTSKENIPTDFIERQLRETQYVSKKAMDILKSICHNVYATSGSVTDYLRHIWGWDEVLHDLHFEQYKAAGLTTTKEMSSNGNTKTQEVIKGWSKRMDHRHHAIDALTVACTSQGIIQQLNTLNTLADHPFKREGEHESANLKYSKLEKYALSQPHFTTEEVMNAAKDVLISFKGGKKVTTPGKRYIYKNGKRILVQRTSVPRGALSEQTVYGKDTINGKEEIVVKQAISSIDTKKASAIVDKGIQRIVIDYLNVHNGKYDESDPILDHQGRPIRSVRIKTGLSAVVPVKYDGNGQPLGYVKPGNNHHIALYRDKNGNLHENVVTFWHAVDRKRYKLPVIITAPQEIFDKLPCSAEESFISQLPNPQWEFVMSIQSNEMFVLGMQEDSYRDAIAYNDMEAISKHLYRVQKITTQDYVFRHHLETTVDDKINGTKNEKLSMELGKYIRIRSIKGFFNLNPHKVRINKLGIIVDD